MDRVWPYSITCAINLEELHCLIMNHLSALVAESLGVGLSNRRHRLVDSNPTPAACKIISPLFVPDFAQTDIPSAL